MKNGRVLVVEDESLIRELMAEALKDAGFEVDEAATSDEAVRLLDADGYHALVTDVHMPGQLDGLELGRRAHADKPGFPIIFVTARPDVMSRLRDTGINGACLNKPFRLSELTAAVSHMIGRAAA